MSLRQPYFFFAFFFAAFFLAIVGITSLSDQHDRQIVPPYLRPFFFVAFFFMAFFFIR